MKIKLKKSAKKFFRRSTVKEFIVNEIQKHPDYDKELKFDNQLIKAVMQTIEDELYRSTDDDKNDIAIDILKQLFNLSNDEIAIIKKIMIFLLENNHIKKHSKLYKFGAAVGAFFFKKIGGRIVTVNYNIISNQIIPINGIQQTLLMYTLVEYFGVSFKIACIIVLFL